ncbi:MAG TPA: hypothetical protein VFK89_01655 [Actinomycetota bacterium]|nr:hypothetical protein [Actinomycetota bacterium]
MSDRERKSCVGKRRYATQREAREVALHRQEESGDDTIWEYACLYCGGWHLGHDRHFKPTRRHL